MTEIQGDNLVFEPPIMFGWGFVSFLTRSQVREALKPVEGQAYFYVVGDNPYEPSYILERRVLPDEAAELRVAVNALTIGLTCGELRELYEWSWEE